MLAHPCGEQQKPYDQLRKVKYMKFQITASSFQDLILDAVGINSGLLFSLYVQISCWYKVILFTNIVTFLGEDEMFIIECFGSTKCETEQQREFEAESTMYIHFSSFVLIATHFSI